MEREIVLEGGGYKKLSVLLKNAKKQEKVAKAA